MSNFDLNRFIEAHEGVYPLVVDELSTGRKRSHWMRFIFKQLVGLGFSAMARRYAICSRAEAQAFVDYNVFGRRLTDCTRLVLQNDEAKIRKAAANFWLLPAHCPTALKERPGLSDSLN